MKIYSNCLEVIKCEEFWEDVMGDTILLHLIVKKLKGGPKNAGEERGGKEVV